MVHCQFAGVSSEEFTLISPFLEATDSHRSSSPARRLFRGNRDCSAVPDQCWPHQTSRAREPCRYQRRFTRSKPVSIKLDDRSKR